MAGTGVGDAVQRYIGVVLGSHLLLLDRSVGIGEHVYQGRHILELRCEAGTHDVVRGGHALDDVAGEIGVDVVSFEEHSFARREGHVVEKEEDEEANVVRELRVQTLDEGGKSGA